MSPYIGSTKHKDELYAIQNLIGLMLLHVINDIKNGDRDAMNWMVSDGFRWFRNLNNFDLHSINIEEFTSWVLYGCPDPGENFSKLIGILQFNNKEATNGG